MPTRKPQRPKRVVRAGLDPVPKPAGRGRLVSAHATGQDTTRWELLGGKDVSAAAGSSSVRVEQVGLRLRDAFTAVLKTMPPRVAKIADIVRWLDLDRSICQRVVAGVRDAPDGLGVLERFPGVRGLEQFIAASSRRGCPASVTRVAREAVEAYAMLVNDAGGSQTRLVDRIGAIRARQAPASLAAPTSKDLERFRQSSYQSAAALTGLGSATRVEVVIVGPSSDSGASLEAGRVTTVSATGLIGVEASGHAMPLTRRSRIAGMVPVRGPGESAAAGLTPGLLLAPFSSQPLPGVTTRTEGEWLIQLFEAGDLAATGEPFDIVAALAMSWTWGTPAPENDSNFYSVGRVIGPPTRSFVFDVYLHTGLPAPRSVSAHVLRPSTQGSLGNARPQSRWYDRLPVEHDVVLLAGPPGSRGHAAYPRLGDLTRHLIEAMHWEAVSFVGYRLEVPYPMFDMEYVLSAEY